jgi:hypothetical protein
MSETLLTPSELYKRRLKKRRQTTVRRVIASNLALLAFICCGVFLYSLMPSPSAKATSYTKATPKALPSKITAPFTTAKAQVDALASIPSSMLSVYQEDAAVTGVPWQLLAAVGKNESDNDLATEQGIHSGVNENGCCSGPAQICVIASCGETWQHYSVGEANVYDPKDSFIAAGRYITYLKSIVGNNISLLLAAYNAGPGAVEKYGGVPPFTETEDYVDNGVALASNLGLR